MADITKDQKVLLIEFFYTNGKSKAAAIRNFRTRFGRMPEFSDSTLAR